MVDTHNRQWCGRANPNRLWCGSVASRLQPYLCTRERKIRLEGRGMTRLINNEVHALLFDTVMTNGYYTHLTVRVVARDGATLHNPARESAFDDLEFSCQMDKDTVEERRTYGWNVRYRAPFTVELVDAERMAKALRRIAKIQEKFPIRPTT